MAESPASRTLPLAVWAPTATTLRAVLPAGKDDGPDAWVSLTRDDAGVWHGELPADTDYLFAVDDQAPRPDPRSPRQPHGIHGPSRTFDAGAFAWTDAGWRGRDVLGGVLYEIHVGTFTPEGTLDAAIGRLDYLATLGIDTVELMPIVPFPGDRGWGYDGVSLYAVHEAYGGPAALQRFVDAAHARGLAVCLDVVYNHFGPDGNYAPVFGPYFTDKHSTPWGSAINLDDEHADGVRAFIVDNAVRWLRDFHVDALRLDAVHALVDDSPRHILAELSDAVAAFTQASGRVATLIAESDENQVTTITPTADGGRGMDGQWADDVHHALHAWLTGERFGYYVDFGSEETLAHAFEHVFVHDGTFSTFRNRTWGAPVPDDVERTRFVVFDQNHDQVGNRGLGDRPSARLAPAQVAGGAALLLLSPFTPLLFQGEEWGTQRPFLFFTDHSAELGAAVTRGRRAEFATHGWAELYGPDVTIPDPQALDTFAASRLDWDEPTSPAHAPLLGWYRTLLRLRREHLGEARQEFSTAHGPGWFSFRNGPLRVTVAAHADTTVPAAGSLVAAFGSVEQAPGAIRLICPAVAVTLE
jgi:maltooligosyltrehalose trehalohydrolase